MTNTIYFDENKNPYHPYTMSEKASTHPGYRFSRTLENLRKRHERYRRAEQSIAARPLLLRIV
jgi:hypothetical protein